MVYPIYVYGQPVLRKVAKEIDKNYPNFHEFLDNMFETMEKSDGLGLAAPQVGESIRLFVIDGKPLEEEDPTMKGFRKAFINAKIIELSGEDKVYNEGCLSLPKIREDVTRKSVVRLQYFDEQFNFHDEVFEGMQCPCHPTRIRSYRWYHVYRSYQSATKKINKAKTFRYQQRKS